MIANQYIQVSKYVLNISYLMRREDSKGTRWMPWHQTAMKDVASCDNLR